MSNDKIRAAEIPTVIPPREQEIPSLKPLPQTPPPAPATITTPTPMPTPRTTAGTSRFSASEPNEASVPTVLPDLPPISTPEPVPVLLERRPKTEGGSLCIYLRNVQDIEDLKDLCARYGSSSSSVIQQLVTALLESARQAPDRHVRRSFVVHADILV